MASIKYRNLAGYKYMLMEDYQIQTAVLCKKVVTQYFEITPKGLLTIKKGYCWDGASGPALDTRNFMRGSLVHDVLYQMMRLGAIHNSYREYADNLLTRICREDGMSALRSWWVLRGVRWFGRASALVDGEPEIEVLTAP